MERPRDRLECILGVRELVRRRDPRPPCGRQEQPVVGTDVVPAFPVEERQRTSRTADSRIDDREVHSDGHVADRVPEDERSLQDGLRGDPVGDVDDLRLRRDALDHAVARPHEVVLEPEVAQERDDHARDPNPRLAIRRQREVGRTCRHDLQRAAAIGSPQLRPPRGRMRTNAVGAWSGSGLPTSAVRVTLRALVPSKPCARAQHSPVPGGSRLVGHRARAGGRLGLLGLSGDDAARWSGARPSGAGAVRASRR